MKEEVRFALKHPWISTGTILLVFIVGVVVQETLNFWWWVGISAVEYTALVMWFTWAFERWRREEIVNRAMDKLPEILGTTPWADENEDGV